MSRLQYNKLFLLAVGILLTAAGWAQTGWAQEEKEPPTPDALWEVAAVKYSKAKQGISQRNFSQALGLIAQGRAHLTSLSAQWPEFKSEEVLQLQQEMETQRVAIYQLVSQNGLVEYHGKFYTFDQLQELLQSQKDRSTEWMELLRAQEEVRRRRAERMVAEETKRQVRETREKQERLHRE